MLDEEIFHCFASRAQVKGKSILIDVGAARRLKEKAIFRGFTTKSGIPRKNLTTWDWLVIVMRDATSGEDFNHEWWAAELTKPNWLRKLETLFGNGWLYFPMDGQSIDPKTVGERIAYEFALMERKCERMIKDRCYLDRCEDSDLEKAKRGLEREFASKVRLFIPGYRNRRQLAEESLKAIAMVRTVVMAVGARESGKVFSEFVRATEEGIRKAEKINLDDELSEFNEREEVIRILSENCIAIDRMDRRSQITKFIVSQVPERRQRFLEIRRKEDGKRVNYDRFVERLRQTYYESIGLRPRGRGRPGSSQKSGGKSGAN
jgi:hypothetical protein